MTASAGDHVSSAAALSAAFAARLGRTRPETVAPASLLGLEHEYELYRDGRRVDARNVLPTLGIPGLRLDPADSNAYRLLSGAALTCDETELEVAAPPVAAGWGAAALVESWAAALYEDARSFLPACYELRGTSTHLSFSMPHALNDRAALVFARRFGPALMLLTDRRESHVRL